MTWNQLVLSAIAVSVISMDISRTAIFRPLRKLLSSWCWLHKLVSCPWCLAHWVALAAVLLLEQNVLYTFVVVGLAAVPMLLTDFLFYRLDQFNEDL